MQQNKTAFLEIDLIQRGEQTSQLLVQNGQRNVPQILTGEKPIGGFTELAELISHQEFYTH